MVRYPLQYRINKSTTLVTMSILLSWMTAGMILLLHEHPCHFEHSYIEGTGQNLWGYRTGNIDRG